MQTRGRSRRRKGGNGNGNGKGNGNGNGNGKVESLPPPPQDGTKLDVPLCAECKSRKASKLAPPSPFLGRFLVVSMACPLCFIVGMIFHASLLRLQPSWLFASPFLNETQVDMPFQSELAVELDPAPRDAAIVVDTTVPPSNGIVEGWTVSGGKGEPGRQGDGEATSLKEKIAELERELEASREMVRVMSETCVNDKESEEPSEGPASHPTSDEPPLSPKDVEELMQISAVLDDIEKHLDGTLMKRNAYSPTLIPMSERDVPE